MFDKNCTIYSKLILQNHLDSFPAKRDDHLLSEFALNQKQIEADMKKSNRIDIDDNMLFITKIILSNKILDRKKHCDNEYNGPGHCTLHVDP